MASLETLEKVLEYFKSKITENEIFYTDLISDSSQEHATTLEYHYGAYPLKPYYKTLVHFIRKGEEYQKIPLKGYIETNQWDKRPVTDTLSFIQSLSPVDIQSFLGIRHTVGTISFSLPPCFSLLLNSFQKPWSNSNLTVGARALSKHCHRSGDDYWYKVGDTVFEYKGSESHKNDIALRILHKVFRESVWLNCHSLPHSVAVVEVRVCEGYGMRWSLDGSLFRGFLEPWMEDGHEKKWRQ